MFGASGMGVFAATATTKGNTHQTWLKLLVGWQIHRFSNSLVKLGTKYAHKNAKVVQISFQPTSCSQSRRDAKRDLSPNRPATNRLRPSFSKVVDELHLNFFGSLVLCDF